MKSSKNNNKPHIVTYMRYREINGVRSYFINRRTLLHLIEINLSYADIYLDKVKVL